MHSITANVPLKVPPQSHSHNRLPLRPSSSSRRRPTLWPCDLVECSNVNDDPNTRQKTSFLTRIHQRVEKICSPWCGRCAQQFERLAVELSSAHSERPGRVVELISVLEIRPLLMESTTRPTDILGLYRVAAGVSRMLSNETFPSNVYTIATSRDLAGPSVHMGRA